MQKYLVISCFLVAFISSCKSSGTKPAESAPGLQGPTQLTFVGDNGESYFSPDGKKLLFQSKLRPEHANSQIYMYDLETKKETRINHNDGDDTCSYFSPDGKRIIYASTTDEIKERPRPSPTPTTGEPKKYEWKFQDYEIYSANPDGSDIKRLTKSKGYDAEGVFSPDGKKIIFTSIRTGDLELYTMDSDGKNVKRLTNKKGYDGGAFISPDGKSIVWRGFHDDKGNAQIYVSDTNGKNIKQITTKEAIHWCPYWTPDSKGIVFSSNRDDKKNFELYTIKADGTCLKRITNSAGADILPSLSADGKKLTFTSTRGGDGKVSNIFVMDFVEPAECSTEVP